MAAAISPIEGINFFMPIFAFLFVFVLVFALLVKTKILGDNKFVHIFISFIMAIFFVVNASLVDFIRLNTAWFAVFLICIFFIFLLIGFTHGKVEILQQKWVGWTLIVGLLVFFVISSSFVFNWAINLEALNGWFDLRWVGFGFLLIVALVASWLLTKK